MARMRIGYGILAGALITAGSGGAYSAPLKGAPAKMAEAKAAPAKASTAPRRPVSAPTTKVQDNSPGLRLSVVQQKLATSEPAAMIEVLEAVKVAGPGAAHLANVIESVLQSGANAAVMKGAIEALGAIGAPSSSAVLRPYLQHREADLRRAASRALRNTKGQEAVAGFRDGLRGIDAMVRGNSATGLGALGAKEALPDLFSALDHNVTEAAASIGQLCEPNDCEKLLAKLGRLPFDVMTSGLDPMLFREKQAPEALLILIVGKVHELGTPEAAKYLNEVKGRWPENGSKKVKHALEMAVASIPGSPAGEAP